MKYKHKFVLLFMLFLGSMTNLCFAQQLSTWDFYTKYLANASEFTGTYYYNKTSKGATIYELVKSRWELFPHSEFKGQVYRLDGWTEFFYTNVDYGYNRYDYDGASLRLNMACEAKALCGWDSSINTGPFYTLDTNLSIPVLTSENNISFFHDQSCGHQIDKYDVRNCISRNNFNMPQWEIINKSKSFSLTNTLGDLYQFSCDFESNNFDYKVESFNSGGILHIQNMLPSLSKIELRIDKKNMTINDEFGEWQWDDEHTHFWLDSKGKGILNYQPISLNIHYLIALSTKPITADLYLGDDKEAHYNDVRYTYTKRQEFELELKSDDFEFVNERTTLPDNSKIFDIEFNFGNGNIPITFVGKADDNGRIKSVKFANYNRFKNSISCNATSILDQMKDNDYCVVTLKNKSGNYQSYVYRLEGLSVILDNIKSDEDQ
ncbi:MAG: hypothetical protein J6B13_10110 [Muribaculaceae bacterium]|nr:hypothetical protein [Muribaculaceae bacterium]